MKLVTAIIKPFKLEDVEESLRDLDVQGMTVTEVRGFGRQGGHTEVYRGAEYRCRFLPKLSVQVSSPTTPSTRSWPRSSAGAETGKIGDGKVWMTPVDRVVRVRRVKKVTTRWPDASGAVRDRDPHGLPSTRRRGPPTFRS